MDRKLKIIIASILGSIILLITFSIMEIFDSKILTLDIKWLIVSGIPILIGLFLSGMIKSFKGFGIELETSLSEKLNFELVGTIESYPSLEITKQSMQYLFNMPQKQKLKIERLQFEYGKVGYYEPVVVKDYINALSRLRYIEIIDSEGRFFGLLPAGKFRTDLKYDHSEMNVKNIELLIKSIERSNIQANFNDFITDSIKKNDSLLEAYKKFTLSGQGKHFNGDQFLPVVDSNDKMIGYTTRNKLSNKISEQVLKANK
jgi:hypothetical protein